MTIIDISEITWNMYNNCYEIIKIEKKIYDISILKIDFLKNIQYILYIIHYLYFLKKYNFSKIYCL